MLVRIATPDRLSHEATDRREAPVRCAMTQNETRKEKTPDPLRGRGSFFALLAGV